jgi:hypothetical protein
VTFGELPPVPPFAPLFQEGPRLLGAWPLWSSGVRRPGKNSFGFDWHAPQIEPAKKVRKVEDDANSIGRAWWSDIDNFANRKKLINSLAWKKKSGTREAPIRRKQGTYPETALELRTRDMYAPAAAGLFRLMAFATGEADSRSGRIVFRSQDDEGDKVRERFFSRCEIADAAGFPVRVDDSKGPEAMRVRAWMCDDRIEDAISAGLLFRHELVRKKAVEFKVTNLAWILCGAQKSRDQQRARDKKAKAAAEAAAEAKAKAAADKLRPEPRKSPDLGIALAKLGRAMDPAAQVDGWPARDGTALPSRGRSHARAAKTRPRSAFAQAPGGLRRRVIGGAGGANGARPGKYLRITACGGTQRPPDHSRRFSRRGPDPGVRPQRKRGAQQHPQRCAALAIRSG